MVDTRTQKTIRVSVEGDACPHLMVTVDQLNRVRELFDRNGIDYWVEHQAISLDRRPAIAFVNLGLTVDPTRAQAILDQAG